MRHEYVMFVLAAVGGACLTGESTSLAVTSYRTFHPVDCLLESNSGNMGYSNDGQIVNKSAAASAELWCQAPQDSYLPLHSTANLVLTVSGWDSEAEGLHGQCGGAMLDCTGVSNMLYNNVCARACRTNYSGSPGGYCGAWAAAGTNNGGQVVHIAPSDLSCWRGGATGTCANSAGNWDDTYYVDVYLCGAWGSNNALWGMSVNTP